VRCITPGADAGSAGVGRNGSPRAAIPTKSSCSATPSWLRRV